MARIAVGAHGIFGRDHRESSVLPGLGAISDKCLEFCMSL